VYDTSVVLFFEGYNPKVVLVTFTDVVCFVKK